MTSLLVFDEFHDGVGWRDTRLELMVYRLERQDFCISACINKHFFNLSVFVIKR